MLFESLTQEIGGLTFQNITMKIEYGIFDFHGE